MKKCDYCPEKAIGCRPATCPICGEVFCDNLNACPACGWCEEEECWKLAQKAYEEGDMQSAANCYAEAMQKYYECASDLIEVVRYKEVKGEMK